jgi:hypothetical protein
MCYVLCEPRGLTPHAPDARNRGDLSRRRVPTAHAVQTALPRAGDADRWAPRHHACCQYQSLHAMLDYIQAI